MTQHYFSEKQESPLRMQKISSTIRGKAFSFFTGSGVFSKEKVDDGSKLLIESMQLKKGVHVLDLGCGYGPVGIILKKIFPTCDITLSEINERAVHLAQSNAALNNVEVEVRQSNIFENVPEKFDIILLNPPQSAGKELCFQMITESFNHLTKRGKLIIVARHNKGGKELSKKMESVFSNVKEGEKSAGFRIYESERRE